MEKEKAGNSKAQSSIEEHIFEQLKSGKLILDPLNFSEIQTGNPKTGNTKFQVDFFLPDILLGEVYTCKRKLLSGQRKKIHSDILKMLTIEKIWEKQVKKVIIIVLSQEGFEKEIARESFIAEIISNIDKIKVLGSSTWILKTTELFDIKVYYYLLNPELSLKLEQQQANQIR